MLAKQIAATHFDMAVTGDGFVFERRVTVRIGNKPPLQVIVRGET